MTPSAPVGGTTISAVTECDLFLILMTEFSGHVKGVQLAIAKDAESLDHLVTPEDAVRIAMARQ